MILSICNTAWMNKIHKYVYITIPLLMILLRVQYYTQMHKYHIIIYNIKLYNKSYQTK